jgi:hypothetical protein
MSKRTRMNIEKRQEFYRLARKAARHTKEAQGALHRAHDELLKAHSAMFDAMDLDIQPDGRHDWHGEMLALRTYKTQVGIALTELLPLFSKLPDAVMTEAVLELTMPSPNHVNSAGRESIQGSGMGFAVLRAHERAEKMAAQV